MPSDKELLKKLEKYGKRLKRLQRKCRGRSRTRSRSRPRHGIRNPSPSSNSDVTECVDMDCNFIVQPDNPNELGTAQELPAPHFSVDGLPTPQCLDDENNPQEGCLEEIFLDALGVEYKDNFKFEGKIQNDIAKRWDHILINGLTKEDKENTLQKYKLPENCQLLEAPILNEEVKTVMTENSKNRDRALELVQHQLGLATAVVGQAMTDILHNKEINKVSLLTKLSDATKLLNDIHFQKTKTRRLLISPLLDKNFNNLVEKVKRDDHLYGIDLGSKIKTSQELKKASLQIKKALPRSTPIKPASKYKTSGNQYGLPQTQPRQQTRAAASRGGPRKRVTQPPHQPAAGHSYSRPRPERAAPRGSHSKR